MFCRGRRYRSSGKVGWAFVPLAAATMAAALGVGGVLFLAFRNGLYLVLMTPMACGFAVAGVLVLAVDRGRCRNSVLAGALGLVAGLLMFVGYFQAGVVSWVGPRGVGRVDLLRAYVEFRIQDDELRGTHEVDKGRLAGGNPGGAGVDLNALGRAKPIVNALVLAAECVMVQALLVTIAVRRASRPYDERRGRWLVEVSAAFPFGTGRALAAAIDEDRPGDVAALLPERVKAWPPFSRVILHVDPEPDGGPSPMFLTVRDEVVDQGSHRKTTLLDRVALTAEEGNALSARVPIPWAAPRPADTNGAHTGKPRSRSGRSPSTSRGRCSGGARASWARPSSGIRWSSARRSRSSSWRSCTA